MDRSRPPHDSADGTGKPPEVQDVYALTPMQQGLLFHSLESPEAGLYFSQLSCTLDGALDTEAFEAAWCEVLARHPSQRTTFHWQDLETPVQVVWEHVSAPFQHHDWRALAAPDRDQHFEDFLESDRRRGFDLNRPPLSRFALLRTGDHRHRFLWSSHHLLTDGWSFGLILQEVFELYRAKTLGSPVALPPSRPYRDYVDWLGQQDLGPSRAWFAQYLAGASSPTPLPFGAEGSAARRPELFDELRVALRPELERGLAGLAAQQSITLSTLLHGAFGLVLARFAGEREAVFGTTLSGRPPELDGVERIVGLFINTLPCRVAFEGEARLSDWLRELHFELLELQTHQHVSLVGVHEASEVRGSQPLFESLLVFENYPLDEAALHATLGLHVRDVRDHENTNFPLVVVCQPGETFTLRVLFDAERFSSAAIQVVVDSLVRVLERFCEQPDAPVAEVALLAPSTAQPEDASFLRGADRERPATCLHELFFEAAARAPQSTALLTRERELSYDELSNRVRRIRSALVERGIGPGSRVAIQLRRSVEAVAAILAVLEVGAAYVPLDPGDPLARRQFVVGDSGAELIIAASGEQEFGDVPQVRVQTLDSDPTGASVVPVDPEQPAYIIYTSGSTGAPKGVLVSHRAAASMVQSAVRRLELTSRDRVLQATSLCFDVSVMDLFSAFMVGATLCIGESEALLAGADLEEHVRRYGITFFMSTPAVLATIEPQGLPTLRKVVSGGEACPPALLERWLPHVAVFSAYGPTEAAILATLCRVASARGVAPLRDPLDGVSVAILDRDGNLLPRGAQGEIHLGGDGLALGYVGNAGLTAARFRPRDFVRGDGTRGGGERFYATGDRARIELDGTLTFLGRFDAQVKVRGFRIELGEIELALGREAGVEEAAVVVQRSGTDAHLVAHVAGGALHVASGALADPDQIRAGLLRVLPAHMVPASIVCHAALPKTRTGKLDRRSLEDWQLELPEDGPRQVLAPLTGVIAEIWSDLLGSPISRREDDFFERGGHSLLATRLLFRIREAFGVELPLRAIFDAPSLADFSDLVAAQRGANPTLPPPSPRSEEQGNSPPLSLAQRRMWILERLDPELAKETLHLALALRGPLDEAALGQAVDEIVARHEVLRTAFADEDGRWVQRIEPSCTGLLDIRRSGPEAWPRVRSEEVPKLLALPFDLERAPLLRAYLFTDSEREHLLLLHLHHAVTDAWSMEILVRDLGTAYSRRVAGGAGDQDTRAWQYADFARYQAEVLEPSALHRDAIEYFRDQLRGAPPLLDLPTDRPRPPIKRYRGATIRRRLDPALVQLLREVGRREGASMFMTLLAGLKILLARLSSSRDLVVGTPISGRDRPEWETVAGLFVNTLALRTRLDERQNFQAWLHDIRERVLGAFEHRFAAFDQVVEAVHPARSLSHTPLFQVMFVHQNEARTTADFEGLTTRLEDFEECSAKFDWTVYAVEGDGSLELALEFDTDLFEPATAARHLERLESVYRSVASAPEAPLFAASVLTPQEHLEVSQAVSGPPRSTGDVEPFELPEAVQRAATRLQQRGCATGSTVVLLHRGEAEAVDALLAIWAAGSCAAPIHAGLPQARIRAHVARLQPTLTLVQGPESVAGASMRLAELFRPQEHGGGESAEPCKRTPVDWDTPALWVLDSDLSVPVEGFLLGRRTVEAWASTQDDARALRAELSERLRRPSFFEPEELLELPGARAWVLDPDGRFAPLGVPGELVLGGLATPQAALGGAIPSARALRPAPPGEPPGSRVWTSGVTARRQPGHRIAVDGSRWGRTLGLGPNVDPRGVAALARRHPDVDQAAVAVRQGESGDLLLVLYVTRATKPDGGSDSLGEALERVFEPSAHPDRIITLDELPLGPDGGLDLSRLPDLVSEPPEAPRSGAERLVAELFASVLGLDSVHSDSDFFELGGHSLLGTQLVSRLLEQTGHEFPLRWLFECSTPRTLAARIEDHFGAWAAHSLEAESASGAGPARTQGFAVAAAVRRSAPGVPVDEPLLRLHGALETSTELEALGFDLAVPSAGPDESGWDGAGILLQAQQGAEQIELELRWHPRGLPQDRVDACVDALRRICADALQQGARPDAVRDDASASRFPPATRRAYARDETISRAFQRCVERWPDRPALRAEGIEWTYRELARRVDQRARQLARHGVMSGDRVALMLPRCADQITTLFAALELGAAYVPVDPELPKRRLNLLLRQTQPRLVVTDGGVAPGTLADLGLAGSVLDLSGTHPDELGEASHEPAEAHPLQPAYVLFTSGSTGVPKGVVVPQRAILRLVFAQDYAAFGPEQVILNLAPLSFDASTLEIFGALLHGATLVLMPAGPFSLEALAREIRGQGISMLWLTAGLFHQLTDRDPGAFAQLDTLLAGGDVLSPAHVRRALAAMPKGTLVNGYGPTECTTFTCCHVLRSAEQVPERVPIGSVLANSRVYVLDANLDPVPVGTPGRLFIAGDGLALGYLGDPQRTAERFLPDPYAPESGARMYDSGDRALVTADGILHFLGRADAQVKVRGYRIELGEVEAQFAAFEGIRQVAVVATGEGPSGKRLEAACVLAPERDPPAVSELRSYLAQRLPSYMLPARFHFVAELPLNRNGKVDRGLLGRRLERAEAPSGERTRLPLTWSRVPVPALVPVPREPAPPLSFAQRRLWFLDQLEPGSPFYNVPVVVEFEGGLDEAAFASAWMQLVERHETLRTRFDTHAGQPIQVVGRGEGMELLRVAASGFSTHELREWLEQEARRPFDLQTGPLARASLVRIDATHAVFCLVLHHIVIDGWSVGLLLGELAKLYVAAHERQACSLPELPLQYADFADWQQRCFAAGSYQADLDYWLQELGGELPVLDLPTDRPRGQHDALEGASLAVRFGPQLTRAVRDFSRARRVTPFMTLMAAFQTLLYRMSGQTDILVGTPVAGRTRVALESIAGLFVNTVVLRAELGDDPGFEDLVDRTAEKSQLAYRHQALPFDKLVEVLAPDRDPLRTPVFQALFVMQNVPRMDVAELGLHTKTLDVHSATSRFDLCLSLEESDGGLEGFLEYSAALFDRRTAERLLTHFEVLLEAALRRPQTRVSELPLLSEDQRGEVLSVCGTPREDDWQAGCLHHAFERTAERHAEFPAASFGGNSLSYAELDRVANRVARALRERGLRPGGRAGICLRRGLPLVIAQLATLKVGAAVVPLDADYPFERLRIMLEQACCSVLVLEEATRSVFGDDLPLPLVSWNGTGPDGLGDVERYSAGRLGAPVDPDNLAYVVFTSGSTGQPKGVAMPHGDFDALITWQVRTGGYIAGTRVMQFAAASFDVFFQELCSTWYSGGELVMVDEETRRDLQALWARIVDEGIQRLFLPYAALRQLAALVDAAEVPAPALERVIVAGEQLRVTESVQDLFRKLPHGRLENHYGPSETHLATAYLLAEDPDEWDTLPPIGRPREGYEVRILDRHGALVPYGVVGELYVSGPGVARGYLGPAARTAERFVPDPYSQVAGRRMYATGDRVRLDAKGRLRYLGRSDDQVKIRGYRVEPGEIEKTLARHSAVQSTVVVPQRTAGGRLVLVAYFVAAAAAEAADLRAFLHSQLPDWMVPAAFVSLERIPLTPNGKVDRRALPAIDEARLAGPSDDAGPGTPLEQLIAAAFAEALERARIGVDDNFFEAGGHSLLATQVVARLRHSLGAELPLKLLFEAPTVARLASSIQARQWPRQEAPPLVAGPRPDAVPLTFAQHRLWILEQMGGDQGAYHLPLALLLRGPVDPEAMRAAVDDVVRRHEGLRTTFRSGSEGPEQVVSPEPDFQWTELDRRARAGRVDDEIAELEELARRPFDLDRGPLLRARLTRLEEAAWVLFVDCHHIVTDGWSLGIFQRELAACYRARCQGEAAKLPALPIQPADFALWQRRFLAGETRERQLEFWRERLRSPAPPLEFPLAKPRPAVRSFAGASLVFALDEAETAELRRVSNRLDVTPFMATLAVFEAVLTRLSAQPRFQVGIPVAGRQQREVEGLIGFFVNTLVMRAELGDDPTFAQLARAVKVEALSAFAHQDVPFEVLVESLEIPRDLRHAPLFQVMFAYQRYRENEFDLDRVAVEPLGLTPGTAKYDLTLSLAESDQGIDVTLEYSTALFTHQIAERIAGMFRAGLRHALRAPDCRVSCLRLADDSEASEPAASILLGPAVAPGPLPSIPEAVFDHAGRSPAQPAVRDAAGTLSYGALAESAVRVAAAMRAAGVRPGDPVALVLERSAATAVAAVAALRIGAVYVPLDPDDPASRIEEVLREAEATCALVSPDTEHLVSAAGVPAIVLTRIGEEAIEVAPSAAGEGAPAVADSTGATPEGRGGAELAYRIYTSGSTGKPKGVDVTLASLAALVRWHLRAYSLEPGDRCTLLAGPGFDASVWELWPALTAGACLCVPPADVRLDPNALRSYLLDQGVAVTFLPTPLAEALLDGSWPEQTALRAMLVGGDRLRRRPRASLPFRLINHYGPTEDTVVSTCGEVASAEAEPAGPEPDIGRPIEGELAYVLDGDLRPVPRGVPGELYVGGDGLARGYHGQPAATAAAFLPDPFRREAGARMYRTGDRVWLNEAGALQFLGRVDQQVKVRGVRIELREIEARLRQHPSVRDALVVPRGRRARLDAYVVLRDEPGEPGADGSHLLDHLRGSLPRAMVPESLSVLAHFPMTRNGKLDLDALPEPHFSSSVTFVAPDEGREAEVVQIWQQVLERGGIGALDHFFDVGGHSLGLVAVAAEIQSRMGLEVSVVELFRHPTPRALASHLDRLSATDRLPSSAPAQKPDSTLRAAQERARRRRGSFRGRPS